jgi:hypothetical protein
MLGGNAADQAGSRPTSLFRQMMFGVASVNIAAATSPALLLSAACREVLPRGLRCRAPAAIGTAVDRVPGYSHQTAVFVGYSA